MRPPCASVVAGDVGQLVARQDHLELRLELEDGAVQLSADYPVATSELLHEPHVDSDVVLGLLEDTESASLLQP